MANQSLDLPQPPAPQEHTTPMHQWAETTSQLLNKPNLPDMLHSPNGEQLERVEIPEEGLTISDGPFLLVGDAPPALGESQSKKGAIYMTAAHPLLTVESAQTAREVRYYKPTEHPETGLRQVTATFDVNPAKPGDQHTVDRLIFLSQDPSGKTVIRPNDSVGINVATECPETLQTKIRSMAELYQKTHDGNPTSQEERQAMNRLVGLSPTIATPELKTLDTLKTTVNTQTWEPFGKKPLKAVYLPIPLSPQSPSVPKI